MPVGLVTVVVMLAAGGCAAATARPVLTPGMALPVWPEPPLPTRIAFVQVLADGQSMGAAKAGLKDSFVNFISGRQPPGDHLYQPMDIAASDDGQRVYIADFGQMSVFVGNFATKTFAPLSQPFERPFGIGIDNEENIYVSEQDGKRVTVLNRALQVARVITHPSLDPALRPRCGPKPRPSVRRRSVEAGLPGPLRQGLRSAGEPNADVGERARFV